MSIYPGVLSSTLFLSGPLSHSFSLFLSSFFFFIILPLSFSLDTPALSRRLSRALFRRSGVAFPALSRPYTRVGAYERARKRGCTHSLALARTDTYAARAYTLLGVVYSSSFILPCGGSRGLSRTRAQRARGLGAMTSIFYPLLISMLPPPPPLPPHPPLPPSPPLVRSSLYLSSSSAPLVDSLRSPVRPPLPHPRLLPSPPRPGHPFCGKTCMCIGHIREGITIFSCRTTLAPRRPRPANSPRLPTAAAAAASNHLPQPPTPSHPLSIFSSNLFSSPALLLHPLTYPSRLPPTRRPLCHLLSNRAKSN